MGEKNKPIGPVAKFLNYIGHKHLWLIALIVLPMSLFYDLMWFIRLGYNIQLQYSSKILQSLL